MHQNYQAFKQELLQQASIEGVTASSVSLPTTRNLESSLIPEGVDPEQWQVENSPPMNRLQVGSDFEEVMEIPLLAGRGLSRAADSADVTPVLINETAVQALGWEEPVGKTFQCCFRPTPRVVGVVEDFHYQTLRQQIQPVVIMENTYSPSHVLVRVQAGALSGALDAIRAQWQQVSDAPFEYSFLDQRFEQVYRAERRMARSFTIFAGLAIFIACLGLLGLAAYAAKQREKEIGIRKTLGATATNIVALLSKEFLLLVGIACVIAAPVAYVGMERWLRDFAYRVDVSPWLFVGASVLAALIAFLTISYQALRAARTDPATTLRDE
jgi:putative ABC transport system permease protein